MNGNPDYEIFKIFLQMKIISNEAVLNFQIVNKNFVISGLELALAWRLCIAITKVN